MSSDVSTMASNGSSTPWVKKWFNSETAAAWVFLFPSLVGFTLFYAIPAVRGLYISFTDWDLLTDPNFIGFDNYVELFQDDDFWNSLAVTTWYVIYNIPLQTMLAVFIAVMMDRLTKSMVIRSILLLPWLLPNVVVGLLWLWLLDTRVGIVNAAIQAIGLSTIPFLGSVEWALPSIAGINIWRHVGYTALLIFAGFASDSKGCL